MPISGGRTVSIAIEQTLCSAGYQVERYTSGDALSRGWVLARGTATASRALNSCDLLIYTDGVSGTPKHSKPIIVYEHGSTLFESVWWGTEHAPPAPPLGTQAAAHPLIRKLRRLPHLLESLGWRYYHVIEPRIRAGMLNHRPLYVMANSQHTAARLSRIGLRADVVYPPVDVSYLEPPSEPDQSHTKSVVTVSRIVSSKQYEFMINVVADSAPLYIIGSTTQEPQYARSLQERFPHVRYYYDASEAEKRSVLQKSIVYLHAALEDYGITIVEAMAAGCIPIVPDAWGHRETVPWPELRYKYQDLAEARAKLEAALSGKYDSYLPRIREHVKRFDVSVFDEKLLDVVRRADIHSPPCPSSRPPT